MVYARPVGKGFIPRREVIFTSSPTGRDPIRPAVGTSPLLSPDGRWVAYDGGGLNPTYKLRLVSAFGFSFSPDGSMLAYQHTTGRGSDIFTIDLHSDGIRRLTSDGRSGSPLWGPPGIAFERYGPDRCADCHGGVWLMSPTGSSRRRLTHTNAGIYPAAWSADGTRMPAAYPATHNGRLYAVAVPAGTARALTPFVGDLFPQGLSRDGRTVLAAIGCGGLSLRTASSNDPSTGGHPTVIVRGPCRASSNF